MIVWLFLHLKYYMKKWNQLAYSRDPITAFEIQLDLNDLWHFKYVGILEATRNENKKSAKASIQ